MKMFTFTLSSLVALGTTCAQIPACVADTATQLKAFFNEASERGVFRGAVVVMDQGNVIFEFASGEAEKGARTTRVDSPFYLASLSKQFTASAIMLLEERGDLSYDESLARHLPELPEWAKTITIRHLLTNTSGLGDYLDADLDFDGLTNANVVAHTRTLDGPAFPPGERYSYSNTGYLLLARIVERVSGQTLREFTTTNIFEPLGMTSAVFNDETRPDVPDRVYGYDRYGCPSESTMLANGAGGMYASARDLARWNLALCDDAFFEPSTLDEAFTVMTLNDGAMSPYGFGWHIHDRDDGKALHHTGSLAGFRNFMFVDLAKLQAVIMLTNGGDSFPLPAMATGVTNILRGRPAEVPQPALVDHLFAFAAEHPQDVRAEAARLRETEDEPLRESEDDLNGLGYAFLGMQRFDEAIGAFEAALDAYPDSANAYDSYAEALMRRGAHEAVANYRRSLELDPGNDNAREMLDRIRQLMDE